MARETDRKSRYQRAGFEQRDSEHGTGSWTSISLPEGVEVFSPKAETYKFDIVPYVVGEHNPYCRHKGMLYPECTYWVHAGVGPNNSKFCCPSKNRKQKCPICEHLASIMRKGKPDGTSDKEWKQILGSFRPKERQLWLINLHEDDEHKLMLYETSNAAFGKLLDKMRNDADEDEREKILYDDVEGGALLKVYFDAEDIGMPKPWIKAYNIEFKARPNGLDSEIVEHGICLDALPKIPSYEELKREFLQTEDADADLDEDEEADRVAKSRTSNKPPAKKPVEQDKDEEVKQKPEKAPEKPKQKPKPEGDDTSTAKDAGIEEGSMVRHRTMGVCEVVRISPDGTSLTLEDKEGNVKKAIGVDDVRIVKSVQPDSKQEEKKPEPKQEEKKPERPAAKKPADDDDWDDDPPKKPVVKPEKAPNKKSDPDDDWDD